MESAARDTATELATDRAARPAVSIVMPFAGDAFEATEAAATLLSLERRPDDELILADNSGTARAADGVTVVVATGERSPAHARNAGAASASRDWILFLDADCRPRPDLLDQYFSQPVAESVGALAGEVLGVAERPGPSSFAVRDGGDRSWRFVPRAGKRASRLRTLALGARKRGDRPRTLARGARKRGDRLRTLALGARKRGDRPRTLARSGRNRLRPRAPLAARYGAAKSFLSQRQHLSHPYRPRAVAANLLVRRHSFVQVGGFYEGLRAAEDTDFAWRLQQAGWSLELRPEAWVEHHYRATLRELRQQWRGYAAGRAWLARRYEGFVPEPALPRALARLRRRPVRRRDQRGAHGGDTRPVVKATSRLERGQYLAVDALLAFEELAGLALSNRPATTDRGRTRAADVTVVFVADRFPIPNDPLIELPGALKGARIEAARRPDVMPAGARQLRIDYREDDGMAERLIAAATLILAHPLRCLRDAAKRRASEPSLLALSPAVRRLQRAPGARVQPLGGDEATAVAARLEALAGRRRR